MTQANLVLVRKDKPQAQAGQKVFRGYGCRRPGFVLRCVAGLLAMAGMVACGGGGVSTTVRGQASAQFSSSILAFGNQALNTPSSPQTITLTNAGTSNLAVSTVTLGGTNSGDFAKTADTCTGATVAASATCDVSVKFTPMASGSRAATLTFADNTSSSPHTISLSGTGTAPAVSLSAANLSFSNQDLSVKSAAMTETVTNSGTATLTISTVTLGGTNGADFAKGADTCTGATVAPNATCAVNVTFTPSALGSRSATLSFADNASGSPQTVGLSGTGASSTVQFSATSLAFNNQLEKTTSAAQTVTVTNKGSVGLAISTVTLTGTNSGDFAKSADTCTGTTVAANATCAVSITFTPSALGSRSAALSFADNASGGPQTVSLSGTGTAPAVSLSTASLSFGNQGLSVKSGAMTETVTNSGTANLTISTVTLGGTNAADFAKGADTCTGATVAPNATCAVGVTFTPSALGSRSASLSFADNASGSPQTVGLSGTGASSTVQFSAPSLTFTNQLEKTTSADQTVTVTNTGALGLAISAATLAGTNSGDFAKSADTCTGATVATNATCAVSVTFTPSATGSRTASLNFADNASGSPQVVSLIGTGTAPAVGLSLATLAFGSQELSVKSSAMTETVTNSGTANLTISTVTLTGTNAGDFAKSSDACTGATVIPNATCAVKVTFMPSALGNRGASLNFTDNAANTPQAVSLTGTGAEATTGLSPANLSFGGQTLNTASTAMVETLTNNGSVDLSISSVTISGTNASEFTTSADTCTGAVVVPAGDCTISVTFTPLAMGVRSAAINFNDDATTSPQTANLTGTGISILAGVYTQRYDNARTSQNTQEQFLTVSNVTAGRFGKLFTLPVDGQVYSQPLYVQNVTIPSQGVHNVVYITTQHNSVYAFDADGQSTTPLWQVSFLNASAGVTTVPCADVYGTGADNCDISPEIGITSTPVIDPSSGTLYVAAKTREPLGSVPCTASGSYDYCYRLHALDITTGAEKFGGPVIFAASVPGTSPVDSVNGTVTFGAFRHLQRPGLLLLNGTLYVGFGSHGDNDPYHGWLMAYNPSTLQQTAVFNVTPNGTEGAIWQSGGGISADENGYIYVVTANGDFTANTGGIDYSDSVVKLQLQSGQFQVVDYFTPANQATLASQDLDLGSSPALILPDQTGTYAHLLVTGGKDGRVWILNRDNLGQYQTNDAGKVYLIPGLSDGLFAGVTYWNGNLYLQEIGDDLNQYALQNGVTGTPISSPDQIGGFPDSPAVVSSNGTANAVLWLVQATAYQTPGPAVLLAFDANNVNSQIYSSSAAANGSDQAGPAVKFAVPSVANGKVYVGTAGEVDVYGLLP
jgi:hypothetical protein